MHANTPQPGYRTRLPFAARFTPHAAKGSRGMTSSKQLPRYGEGPVLMRLALVLSSMSPLLLLWAIRGTTLISQWVFVCICLSLFFLFNSVFFWIYYGSLDESNIRPIEVEQAQDVRQDIIAYLFAMMLPFYTADLDSGRNVAATAVAFAFVVFLFWGLGLHYLNLWIVIFGYHCWQITSPDSKSQRSSAASFMVISKNPTIHADSTVRGHMVSNTVLVHIEEDE
jgi:hypothetical protein